MHRVDVRSNYLLNSTIPAILLVGTNPRHEAAVLNSRIRKSWLHTGQEEGYIRERADTTNGYSALVRMPRRWRSLRSASARLRPSSGGAKKPLIILGSAITEHPDGMAVYNAPANYVQANKTLLVTPERNGFSVLQRVRAFLLLLLR
jgi:NADH dehydrogenase (ubiquinone) Fe-S protein 1